MGGSLTETLSWHWLFLINVVPGIVLTIAVPLVLDMDRPDPALLRRMDWPGIALTVAMPGPLQFVLDKGGRRDWFDSAPISALALCSATAAVMLVHRSLTIAAPIIQLRAFANRNFLVGCLLTFTLGMCLCGQSFILSQMLAQVRGYNSLDIGKVMFVTGLTMFLRAPVVGKLNTLIDPRLMLTVAMGAVAFGLFGNARMADLVGFDALFWPQVARGIGLMMCFVPITTAALGTLPRD